MCKKIVVYFFLIYFDLLLRNFSCRKIKYCVLYMPKAHHKIDWLHFSQFLPVIFTVAWEYKMPLSRLCNLTCHANRLASVQLGFIMIAGREETEDACNPWRLMPLLLSPDRPVSCVIIIRHLILQHIIHFTLNKNWIRKFSYSEVFWHSEHTLAHRNRWRFKQNLLVKHIICWPSLPRHFSPSCT